ncbi:hypothetical protein CY35_04G090600 [Sphagnum magellanicum]|nr:hypothetical protein CY35_04G090600 [Sphagnum magellanicum]
MYLIPSCGDHDGSPCVWMISSGIDMLIQLPSHTAHSELEQEQQRLEDKSEEAAKYSQG